MEENKKIKWHPGFYAGIEYELREYREILEFDREHVLSKEPVQMDMLIIKKNTEMVIDQAIGNIFRKYNVIEYKSPEDGLNIDDFYKTIGYACFYKGYGCRVNAIDARELTISLFRFSRPVNLIKTLQELGAVIEEKYSGVYYVNGIINIPVQIVVIGELERDLYASLKILVNKADKETIKKFLSDTGNIKTKAERENIDALLQVSVSANREIYEEIRRESPMCEALRELMKDDIDKAVEQAVEKAVEQAVEQAKITARFEDGLSFEEIATRTNVSVEKVKDVLKEQGLI